MKSTTTKEIKVWGNGRKGLWSVGGAVDIPEDYAEIEPGDAFVTRQVKLRSETVYLRMKKSKRQGYSRLVGILAPPAIIEEVLADARQTQKRRDAQNAKAAVYRSRKEAELNEQRVEQLKRMLPSIPTNAAQDIVERAFEVGSGRVGRTSALGDEEKLRAATIAHIRHCHTDYEAMLDEGIDREEARGCVAGKIQLMYCKWEAEPVPPPLLGESGTLAEKAE